MTPLDAAWCSSRWYSCPVALEWFNGCGLCFPAVDTPAISQQPMDAFVLPGETAMFSVEAFGFNISYQWLFEDNDLMDDPGSIDGVTTNTLTITNVSEMDIGTYRCRVENLLTSVNSTTAELSFCEALPPLLPLTPFYLSSSSSSSFIPPFTFPPHSHLSLPIHLSFLPFSLSFLPCVPQCLHPP